MIPTVIHAPILKLRLQQYQAEHPRGWFSDHRQKAEIAASVLDETTQRVQRLSNQLQALAHQSEQIRQRLQELSSARGMKLRHRDRLEQFQRSFGSHFEEWKGDLILSRDRAEKSRIQQAELRQRASDWEIKSQNAATHAHAAAFRASQFDGERSKLKYFDASKRKPEIAQIEDLRSHYELLLADYDGKVNADSLSQRAQDRDQEAEKQDREFQRVLSKQSELTVHDIEVELHKLPDGVSAQEQLEQTDVAQEEAFRKLGPLKIRVNSADEELRKAVKECEQLALAGALPSVEQTSSVEEHLARVTTLRKTRDEHQELAAAFHSEVDELAGQLTEANHDVEKFERDRQRLESIRSNHQRQFDRLAAHSQLPTSSVSIAVKDSQTLVHRTDELERQLNGLRDRHDALDLRQEEVAKDVSGWSRQERFGKLRSSISHRFIDRAPASLESKAEFDILQLNDCIFQIEQKLQEADKQRDIVIQVLATAVDEALTLLARVSRMSRLPDRLPQAGKQFVKIETKASDNPMERRGHIGELVDELLERGDVGDGLQLIQKAVRRVARRISVRVLHPDLHQKTERVSIAEMRRFSGGERLTSAILLYCALIRLRQSDSNQRSGSSVLILDNPIGTASRLSFLDMQREVAGAMNVQLIYATAVKDLNAVGALENVIRLRNSRADRRTGRHFIEVEVEANGESRQLDAARIVFDSPPSSLIEANSHANNEKDSRATSEVSDDLRPA